MKAELPQWRKCVHSNEPQLRRALKIHIYVGLVRFTALLIPGAMNWHARI